jgi:hypothetical protein
MMAQASHSCRVTTTKIRIEADPSKVVVFLAEHDYPYEWHLETFQNHCISLRIDAGNPATTIGYVWATWELPGVLDVHACTSRRLWLTRELLERLYIIAELFGARVIQTTARYPTVRRLLHNIGWEREGEVYKKTLDQPIVIPKPKDTAGTGDAYPRPAADSGDGNDPGGR